MLSLAAASVYDADLLKMHTAELIPLFYEDSYVPPRGLLLTCVPQRRCILAESDPVPVLHAHWSSEWNSPETR